MSDAIKITPEPANVATRRAADREPAAGWVLVAPERVFKADGIASVILQRCDGSVSVAQMADEFAAAYKAPRDRILSDITALLAHSPTSTCWNCAPHSRSPANIADEARHTPLYWT